MTDKTLAMLPWNQKKQFVSPDYDAIERDPSQRTNKVKVRIYNEDELLEGKKRHKMSATAQSLVKNFSLAAWIIRKHLDYVTSFNFQARTDDQGFNDVLETYVSDWQNRHSFDAARRHRMRRAIRMAEARRIVDGDILVQKLSTRPGSRTRGKVQFIESDRVFYDPTRKIKLSGTWVNGVRVDPKTSQAMAYAICNREKGQLVHSHVLPSRTAYLHAYYDGVHRFDQVRGISPIACALNQLKDTYEGFDLILAKIRVNQMFGLKITREDQTDGYGAFRDAPASDPVDADTSDESYDVDLSTTKNFLLDMDPGEDADFLESKTPASETTEFLMLMIQVGLKALDIPMSFFSEDFTNFFGSRAALLHYLRSAKSKIEDNQELLSELTRWRLGLAVVDGDIALPRNIGFEDIAFEWVPEGVPWWDPAKEVRGHKEAIGAGLDNPQNVARINNTDFYDNIDQIAAAQEYARERDVELQFGTHTPHPRGVPAGEISPGV